MTTASIANGAGGDLREFIARLRRNGVALWMENDVLRFRAPKGLLTADDIDALRRSNESAALQLREAIALGGPLAPGMSPSHRVPLSFSQLAHWNLRCRAGGRPIRQVAAAMSLRGALSVETLEWSVAQMIGRHDALRTRIVVVDGVPQQEIGTTDHSRLELISLTSVPEFLRQAEVQRHIRQAILEPVDYASSPLFRAVLLKVHDDEHVFILALDHIISDGYSLKLLFEEILLAYGLRLQGAPVELPAVETQFADYAARQRAQERGWLEGRKAQLPTCGRTRFPFDSALHGERNLRGWGIARDRIDAALWNALRAWAKVNRTTPVMAILTAYAALILRWCNVPGTVVQFMSDGRHTRDVEHTVGYLAFPLYINVALNAQTSFVELLRMVTAEYCRACDQPDFFCAHAQVPSPEFTHNTTFNWLPSLEINAASMPDGSRDGLNCSVIAFEHPLLDSHVLDQEPSVAFSEDGVGLNVEVGYQRSRFSAATMERFARQVVAFTAAMVKGPASCIKDVELA